MGQKLQKQPKENDKLLARGTLLAG